MVHVVATKRVVLVLAVFVAGCTAASAPKERPLDPTPEPAQVARPAAPPKKPARGFEERVLGVRVVHLSGTPEEMGAQMGEMCGADVRFLIENNLKKIPYVAKDLEAAAAKAKVLAEGIPDAQMREMRACAKAAGVEEKWMLLAATVVEVVEEAHACAAVAAWGSATADHETIVGRNLDWFDLGNLHEKGLVVVRHPNDGRPFLSCGFPGIPGVLTGMNDAGLFVADLVQFRKNAPAPRERGVPVMSLVRLALESCDTAAEATSLFEGAPRTVPHNYVVADPSGAAFLETDSTQVVLRPPCGETVAGTNWAEEARGKKVGDMRFAGLCSCIDSKIGSIGAPEIEASLGAANSGPLSVMSVVATPARRRLFVSIGAVPACKGPFVELDGAALLAKDPR